MGQFRDNGLANALAIVELSRGLDYRLVIYRLIRGIGVAMPSKLYEFR